MFFILSGIKFSPATDDNLVNFEILQHSVTGKILSFAEI